MLKKMKLQKTSKGTQSIEERIQHIQKQELPKHIAIIMDGNGRWAKKEDFLELQGIMKECKK